MWVVNQIRRTRDPDCSKLPRSLESVTKDRCFRTWFLIFDKVPIEVDDDGPEGREEQVAHGLAEAGERGPAGVPHLSDEDTHA